MTEVRVQSLGLDRSSNTPVVILQELEGKRVLPIWIGPGEASAIAMELAGMKFSRPLTHDLLVSVISGLGGTLQRVLITRVVDNTYYAELIIRTGENLISVDARPSDSIAVALRLRTKIFADDQLLNTTSIEIAEDTDVAETEGESGSAGESGQMNAEELKEHLRRLNPEDFGRFMP